MCVCCVCVWLDSCVYVIERIAYDIHQSTHINHTSTHTQASKHIFQRETQDPHPPTLTR
jgi:hypothetical protein